MLTEKPKKIGSKKQEEIKRRQRQNYQQKKHGNKVKNLIIDHSVDLVSGQTQDEDEQDDENDDAELSDKNVHEVTELIDDENDDDHNDDEHEEDDLHQTQNLDNKKNPNEVSLLSSDQDDTSMSFILINYLDINS